MTWDPFRELEVADGASREVIDVAYRRLARKFHPDSVESPDAARMVQINRAYRELTNDDANNPASDTRGTAPSLKERIEEMERLADQGDWLRARSRGLQALELAPDDRDVQQFLAECAIALHDWLDAEAAIDLLLARDPQDVESLLLAGECALGRSRFLDARGFAATVIRLSPSNEDAQAIWMQAQEGLRR